MTGPVVVACDPDLPAPDGHRRMRGRKHLIGWFVSLLALALVASIALKAWGLPYAASWNAHADANAAINSLRSGNLAALDRQLLASRADAKFAYYFTGEATPRELGDALATVADSDVRASYKDDADGADGAGTGLDASAYERTLTDLADTLALATRGTGDLALPTSWTNDFTTYSTHPEMVYGNESGDDRERIDQDLANRQNLLLLLSRGRWSTDFLQATTQAFWDWEHDPANAAGPGPWPGVTLDDAKYAPAPNGTYLTDGMVALMAALTANPEASGWAFADFQPGTTTLNYGGADHPIGTFTQYLFFGHHYGEASDTGNETSGATASVTALMSAIQATGGSYADDAIGPLADLHVLQDAMASERAEQDSAHWYEKVGHALKEWGHTALDVIGVVPGVGVVPDAASGVWSAIEGDWAGVGLSAVAMIPFVGAVGVGGKLIKDGVRAGRVVEGGVEAGKLVNRAGASIDESTEAGRLLAKASGLNEGIFDFDSADDFLAALRNPVPGVTYKYGDTTYELAPDGQILTHLSGPDQRTIERNLPNENHPGRNRAGECISSECRATAKLKEEQGLVDYEAENGVIVVRTQVEARVEGLANPRYFDGLALKPDGTYEAIEVKGGGARRTANQAAFDEVVSYDNPATATLDGETIKITSVVLQTVS